MRIIHVGGLASPYSVDGINTVIWTVAAEQARLGHQVELLVSDPPDLAARHYALERELKLLHIPASCWRFDQSVGPALIVEPAVDLVHFHSVFIPRQATLARDLRRWGMPYVVTPHGGLMPQVLERGKLKKLAYSRLVEQARIRQAAAIAYVTPGGEEDIRRFVPDFDGPLAWVANPVDVDQLGALGWRPQGPRPQLAFLGRYDVYHKGLDRLADIARRTPEAGFQTFGIDDPKTQRHMEIIRRFAPPNLTINGPVFGADKLEMLSRSTMYVQVSRWEALSISILEALALGVPTMISESMSMASMFRQHDLGLVVSTQPDLAAIQLRDALANPERLAGWSQRAQDYARRHFAPEAVASKILDIYEEAIAHYYSHRVARFVLTSEADRDAGETPARLRDECHQEDRNPEDLANLLDRRERRVEEVVDTIPAGDDA